jgi:hypothetical protein
VTINVQGSPSKVTIPEGTRTAHAWSWVNKALNGEFTTYAGTGVVGNAGFWSNQGIAAAFLKADGRDCKQLRPSLVGGQLSTVRLSALDFALPFRDTFANGGAGMVEASGGPLDLCANFAAWLRKVNNVDPTSARQFFGFECDASTPLGATATVSRVGLMGDGLVGFRCGSVNCPDGAAAGANGFADVDANSVQPLFLVAPGLKWFHVRVKLIPATADQAGKIAVYVDGRLVFLAFLLANLPRGTGGANRQFEPMTAAVFADFDAVTQLNGFLVYLPEFWLDEDGRL